MATVNVREECIELTAIDKASLVVAQLTGNVESLRKGYDQLAGQLKILAGGVGVGYFLSLAKHSIDAAAHLEDLSKSTGLPVERLAGFGVLARQSGTDLDGLAKGIDRMSVAMGKSPEKFRELGISATDPLQALQQFADLFRVLPDIQQRNA